MKSVPDRLSALSDIYRERNAIYKNDYLEFGDVMAALFPEGITLKTGEEFNRFCLFVSMMIKMRRYSKNVLSGGHIDSLDDVAVFSQMLQEWDEICNRGEV